MVVVVCRKCWIFGSPSGRLLKKTLTLKTTSSMSSGQTPVLQQPQKSSSMAFDLSLSLFLQQLDFTHAFLSLCLQCLPLPLSHKQHFLHLYSDFLSHANSTLQGLPIAFLSPCLTNTTKFSNRSYFLSPHLISFCQKEFTAKTSTHVTMGSISFKKKKKGCHVTHVKNEFEIYVRISFSYKKQGTNFRHLHSYIKIKEFRLNFFSMNFLLFGLYSLKMFKMVLIFVICS